MFLDAKESSWNQAITNFWIEDSSHIEPSLDLELSALIAEVIVYQCTPSIETGSDFVFALQGEVLRDLDNYGLSARLRSSLGRC